MSLVPLERLLTDTGPLDITLWIKEGYAQANVRLPGHEGWACYTEKDAATALHVALAATAARSVLADQAPPPGDDIDDLI